MLAFPSQKGLDKGKVMGKMSGDFWSNELCIASGKASIDEVLDFNSGNPELIAICIACTKNHDLSNSLGFLP